MRIDKTGYYPDGYTSEPEDLRGEGGEESIQTVSKEAVREGGSRQDALELQRERDDDKDAKPLMIAAADNISRILSWVLVPLLMPVYGIIMIFSTSYMTYVPYEAKIGFVTIVFVLNFVVPGILFYILKRIGMIRDVGLNEQKDRTVPYIVCIICLGLTSWFMYYKSAPVWMTMFYVAGAVGGLMELLINFKWKISVHAAGVAGMVALMVRIWDSCMPTDTCLGWLIIWIVLGGLVGSARVWMGRHTLPQVICGYILGFATVYFMTLIR